ncbi:phage tail assembly chaperone GT [Terribacillus saccharophilus]
MDNFIGDLYKQDGDINKILNMPYMYVMDLLKDRKKPKEEKSLIAAFGGG